MRISICNLHNMCENNTLFLTRARQYFRLNGHAVSDTATDSELVLVGGCAVTDEMRLRCEETVLRSMRERRNARFVIFGCLAAFPDGFLKGAGPDSRRLHVIPYHASRRLDELIHARIPFSAVGATRLHGHVPYQPAVGPDDSYVLIGQGCVNNCSYCSIRKAKGHVRSRPEEEVESDVRNLYGAGVRMVTLLADDCGSYGLDRGSSLPELLERLGCIARDLQYKLYTVFPSLFLKQFERLERFFSNRCVPYVCLPAQSGAPRVLNLMNRHYDPDRLAGAIARLRSLDPDVFVYSHFIFNFPTETWEEFEQSIAFARHFDSCVFIGYGENRSTPAAALVPKCDEGMLQEKTRRLEELAGCGKLAAFVVPRP